MTDASFFPCQHTLQLQKAYEILGLDLPVESDLNQIFTSVDTLKNAGAHSITVFHNTHYSTDAKLTRAGLCVTTKALAHHLPATTHVLIHDKPYRAYAVLASHMYSKLKPNPFVHPTALIDSTAEIGSDCFIDAFVVIGAFVKIGKNSIIKSHTVIGDHVVIGENATIETGVTISHSIIGKNITIKPGSRIGQQGFGFHMDEKGHFDVPQLGIVEIGDSVQIGANVCIDRASIGATKIGNGVRIDNLVQIAHNVYIGDMSVLVAQSGVAGSTSLGRFVIVAGQAGLAGHLNIGDNVRIAAQSGLMRNVASGETVAGSPAMPVRDWHKQTIVLQRLIREKRDGARSPR